ncbi:hypothetical protein J6590_052762, partial [Homalodisca vitripennis]
MIKGREHVGASMIAAAHVSDNFIQTLALNTETFPLFPCYSLEYCSSLSTRDGSDHPS